MRLLSHDLPVCFGLSKNKLNLSGATLTVSEMRWLGLTMIYAFKIV